LHGRPHSGQPPAFFGQQEKFFMPRLETPILPATHCEELERYILDRTGRRVQELCVEVRDEQVVLRGRTSSYYIKQLAQHSVLDVLPQARLDNAIVVE
jgi:hypothetical protein